MPKTVTVSSYNLTEAAKLVGVSRQTLWKDVTAGRLEVTHTGKRSIVIYADDLLRYIISRRDAKV